MSLRYSLVPLEKVLLSSISKTYDLERKFSRTRLVSTDEANVHVPQTIEAYAEAEQLLGIHANLMNAQTNKPMMGIVYDSLSGAYLLTYPEAEIERLDEEIAELNKTPTPENAITIQDHLKRQRELRKRVTLDPVIFNASIQSVMDAPQFETLLQRLNYYNINPYGGRALISATLPEDFDYNANGVVIKNGILIRGVLSKKTLGNVDGSIIGEMVKQLGGYATVDFMSDVQFVLRDYLQQRGLSVGHDDCIPNDPNFRKYLDEIVEDASFKVIALSGVPTNEIMAQEKERKIKGILNVAKDKGDAIVQKFFHPDNTLMIMAASGAKGSNFNAVQMSSMLGSVMISGERVLANLPGNRALPSIQINSPYPEDRGFCRSSFVSGLEPKEFWFHMQGGREGLTDTAINTAQTGFLQHQIIKSAEDVVIAPEGHVIVADGAVIQFIFGDDGLEASNLSSIKINGENIPLFRNIHQVANKINRKYSERI